MIMKKVLLMLVVFVATTTTFAEDNMKWENHFTPVADKADLDGLHTAVAADGSVYASSTYNQAFTFAGSIVADPEGLLSSCIVKYDAQGNEAWAITLSGKCVINAMTTDADGNLYVAGNYTDNELALTGTSGTKTLEGDITKTSAFVAKVSAAGVFTEAKSFIPTVALPEGYEDWCELGIYPNKIVIDANKVIVSCMFKGDVAELGWQGSYVDYLMMAYMDNRSAGIFMMDKVDLSNASSIATIQHTGRIVNQMMDEVQDYPEAVNFAMYNGEPYIIFVGYGNLTVTTPAGSKDLSFNMGENGNKEHAFVLVRATAPDNTIVFHAANHDVSYTAYKLIGGDIEDNYCYVGGTFYGALPFDNTKESASKTVDDAKTWKASAFGARIDMSKGSIRGTTVINDENYEETEASCMVVAGNESHFSTIHNLYHFNNNTGNMFKVDHQGMKDMAAADATKLAFVFTEKNSVWVGVPDLGASAINEAKAGNNAAAKYYNLKGVELSAPQKGLNIVKTAEGTTKVVLK